MVGASPFYIVKGIRYIILQQAFIAFAVLLLQR